MDPSSCPGSQWCGPPGYTGLSSPYAFRKTCFQSPFVSQCANPALNCITTYASRGNCWFDIECNSGKCLNGACAPADLDIPQVVSSLSYGDYLKYMKGVTGGTMEGVPKARCKEGMVLVRYKGETEPYCPIPYEPGTMPVCQQTMQKLWQCGQYKDKSQPGAQKTYELCKQMENCFIYNVQYPDGKTHPVAVKMNSMCLGASAAAVQQSASRCSTCQPGASATCGGSYDQLSPFMMAPASGCAKNKCG